MLARPPPGLVPPGGAAEAEDDVLDQSAALQMLLENYDEYARHARIFTGIHGMKPKPKLKSGAISEPNALNVDQTNASAKCADQKIAISGGAPPLPSPLAPKPENGQDLSAAMPSSAEIGVSGSKAAPTTLKKKMGDVIRQYLKTARKPTAAACAAEEVPVAEKPTVPEKDVPPQPEPEKVATPAEEKKEIGKKEEEISYC